MAKLAARIAAKTRTFLVKVKAHRGEPLNEGAGDLAEVVRTLEREGGNYWWKERTTRQVYSYYDRNSCQRKKDTRSKTIRNEARRGAAGSLMEPRLQFGANKWRKGLFEGRCEEMQEDQIQTKQTRIPAASDKWDMIASGKWMQKEVWNRMVITMESAGSVS